VPRLIFGGPPKKRFFFINFWLSKFQRVSRIHGRILIGHQIHSFEARKIFFWIRAPYISIIAASYRVKWCVKMTILPSKHPLFTNRHLHSKCLLLCPVFREREVLYQNIKNKLVILSFDTQNLCTHQTKVEYKTGIGPQLIFKCINKI
jgi:hypothetical protein